MRTERERERGYDYTKHVVNDLRARWRQSDEVRSSNNSGACGAPSSLLRGSVSARVRPWLVSCLRSTASRQGLSPTFNFVMKGHMQRRGTTKWRTANLLAAVDLLELLDLYANAVGRVSVHAAGGVAVLQRRYSETKRGERNAKCAES